MDFQIATLCDYAADYNGKMMVTGTFDSLATPQLPVVHPHCSLALRICFTPEDIGHHKFSITIIDDDGKPIDPKSMPIEPEFDVNLPDNAPYIARNIVMNFQGLRFERAGLYSLDISCDGELSVRLPIRIVQVKQQPGGKPSIG